MNGGVSPAAGSSFGIQVQAQNSSSVATNLTVNTTVNISLQAGGGTLSGPTSATLTSGNATFTLSGYSYTNLANSYPEAGVVIQVAGSYTGGTGNFMTSGSSPAFTVNPPVCTSFSTIASASTVTAGVVTTAFTVQGDSSFGNGCAVTAATVGLDDGAATGTFYSDAGGTTAVTSVPWSNGSGAAAPGPHQATFYYKDTVAGARTLTASSSGLSPNATFPLTVNAAAPAKLFFSTVPASASADNTFSVTVQSQDQFGNVSNVASSTPVTLALASGSGPLNGTLTQSIAEWPELGELPGSVGPPGRVDHALGDVGTLDAGHERGDHDHAGCRHSRQLGAAAEQRDRRLTDRSDRPGRAPRPVQQPRREQRQRHPHDRQQPERRRACPVAP